MYAAESSPTVTSEPLTNDGASLTAVTTMSNSTDVDVSSPPLAVPPSSRSSIVIVAVPLALVAGLNPSTPEALTATPPANKVGLVLLVTTNATPWVSGSPSEMSVAHPLPMYTPESSSTVTSPAFVNVGASLTGLTVIVTVAGLEVASLESSTV